MRAETDELLRERGAINKSTHMTDDIINEAMETRSEMRAQRMVFTSARSKLQQIGDIFPGANQLISRIADKKTRDDTVVTLLVAVLVCFTFWWTLLR